MDKRRFLLASALGAVSRRRPRPALLQRFALSPRGLYYIEVKAA